MVWLGLNSIDIGVVLTLQRVTMVHDKLDRSEELNNNAAISY